MGYIFIRLGVKASVGCKKVEASEWVHHVPVAAGFSWPVSRDHHSASRRRNHVFTIRPSKATRPTGGSELLGGSPSRFAQSATSQWNQWVGIGDTSAYQVIGVRASLAH